MLTKLALLLRQKEERQRVLWISIGMGFYLVFPLDIVPDMIPIAGFIDDAIIVFTSIVAILRIYTTTMKRNDLAKQK